MKRKLYTLLCGALATVAVLSAGPEARAQASEDFALGADISWYTEYEAKGYKFHNLDGQEKDCVTAMKDCGLNAIRLRVWVDPAGAPRPAWIPEHAGWQPASWCDKQDLLVKCLKAKEAGMDIMVDFHYSDSWADPGKQPVPRAWEGHDLEQLCRDVAEHTVEVLQLLKDNGITPKWVQIGNETSNGMVWPTGRAKAGDCGNYARLFAAGYDALKTVFPDAIGIVHLDNGWKPSLYDWNLDGLKEGGARWDMIGMSLYPYWAQQNDPAREADRTISDCMDNIRRVGAKYQCPVMITETGFAVNESRPEVMAEGRRQLIRILREAETATDGYCRGVFYWEPECRPSQYKLGAYTEDGHPTVIMTAWKDYRLAEDGAAAPEDAPAAE